MRELLWQVEGGREWIEGREGLVARVEMGNVVDRVPSGLGDSGRSAGTHPPLCEGAGEGNLEVVCWSGWVGEARVEEGWFERSVGAWMPQGVAQREKAVRALVDGGVVIRAHARHLVSDVPACLNLLRDKPEAKLLVDVAGFFEPSMIEDASVHLERIIGGLGGSAWGVVLSDVVVKRAVGSRPPYPVGVGGSGPPNFKESVEEWCVPAACGAGVLDMDRLRELVGAYCGDGVRVIERV